MRRMTILGVYFYATIALLAFEALVGITTIVIKYTWLYWKP